MKYTLLLLLSLLLFPSCLAGKEDLKEITINNTIIKVEIADDADQRQTGLMNRKSLDAGRGMLFIFEEEQKMTFWMKNTSIPLSIAYISKSGEIKEIHHMEPYSLAPVQSRYTVLYALEVNQGFYEKNGITAGDKVQFRF